MRTVLCRLLGPSPACLHQVARRPLDILQSAAKCLHSTLLARLGKHRQFCGIACGTMQCASRFHNIAKAKSLHRSADFLHIQNFQSIPQNAAANNATGDFNKHFIYSKLWPHTCTASAQSSPQAYHSHHKRELALCNNISCLSCRWYWCKKQSFS